VAAQIPSSRGTRLQFEHGLIATVTESEYRHLQGSEQLVVEIPVASVYFIGK
jgi:hypothetical protein